MTHFENALFTFDFHFGHLPTVSDGFFKNITEVHQYKTRQAEKNALYTPSNTH